MTTDDSQHRTHNRTPPPELSTQLHTLLQQISTVLQTERVLLLCYAPNGEEVSTFMYGATLAEHELNASHALAEAVRATGHTRHIPNTEVAQHFPRPATAQSPHTIGNALVQPVLNHQQQVLGVMQILNKHAGDFTDADIQLAQILSQQVALTLEHGQLYQQVSELLDTEQDLTHALAEQQRALQAAHVAIANPPKRQWRWLKSRWTLALFIGMGLTLGWWLVGQTAYDYVQAQWAGENTAVATTPDKLLTIETQALEDWLRLKGSVRPITWVEVTSPLDAIIQQLHFRYGETVQQGQLLVTLDTTDQQRKLREANAALIKAEDEVDKLLNWGSSLEVLRARREARRAEEKLARSQRLLQETQRLFDKGIVSGDELEREKAAAVDQEQAVISARESLQETLASGGPSQLRIARLTLENARQSVLELEEGLAQAKVHSPANGMVFPGVKGEEEVADAEQAVRVGAGISRNASLLAIADLRGIAIESKVSEAQLSDLEIKQPAKIAIKALPNFELEGYIAHIAGRANPEGLDLGRGNIATFNVEVAMPDMTLEQRAQVRIGMSAEARIKIYENPAGIVVPFEALIVEDEARRVTVMQADGSTEEREVTLGITLVDGIEITEGLAVGEQILLLD